MTKRQLFISLVAVFACTASSFAQGLVEWRGPNRTGIYNETGLLKVWPEAGPKLLWSYDGVEKGFTSVTIVGEKIYTTGQNEGVGHLFAFDMKGKLLWKVEYGKEWNNNYPGSRTTPVYSKGKLYLETGNCVAVCLDAETGKIVWSVDMQAKYGAKPITFGFVDAPAIVDNKVIYTPGGPSVAVVALDAKTGELIWKSAANGAGEQSAYCSPLVFDYKNKKYMVTALAKNLVCLDVNDGTFMWNISQVNQTSIHPNTPIYKDGQIFSVTGYKTGGVMIKLSDDGKSATDMWRNTSMDSQIGASVWVGDYIVGSGSQNDRSWQCLDPKTGKVLFNSTEIGKGAVIYADGLLYCYSDTG